MPGNDITSLASHVSEIVALSRFLRLVVVERRPEAHRVRNVFTIVDEASGLSEVFHLLVKLHFVFIFGASNVR